MAQTDEENTLLLSKHVLWTDEASLSLAEDFCGIVVPSDGSLEGLSSGAWLFVCGNVRERARSLRGNNKFARVFVVADRATDYDGYGIDVAFSLISAGQVPRNVCNAGVLFPRFWASPGCDFFGDVASAHAFQALRESNKPTQAFRTGIYLTPVTATAEGHRRFRLLRCSTNFEGSTDNFRPCDERIVAEVQSAALAFFLRPFRLNHVLAQIYRNSAPVTRVADDGSVETTKKETKARIKEHSDKTKDMPKDAIIAFCTFYESTEHQHKQNGFDLMYGKGSVLTTLRFRLKKELHGTGPAETFDVKLFPNSVFLIPLSTNRIYTHEIVPPHLPAEKILTRMGYVIRCSTTEAVSRDGVTLLMQPDGATVPLQEPSPEGIADLKNRYRTENATTEVVRYDDVRFSLNQGDYLPPML